MRRVVLVLGLACLLLAPSAAGAATRILAVGDFGIGGETQRATGAAIERFESTHPAQALVTLGDNDYSRGRSFARNWRESFGWLEGAGVHVAGTLGNHDYEAGDRGAYELELLGMPRRSYTRRVGDVQLFLLDSNDVSDAQTRWLERRLRASTARWKVAAFHHPPWACGGHLGHRDVARRWVPLFERHGVQLVLSGHDHSYQRFAPVDGIAYVIHGGGGAGLYPIVGCLPIYPKLEVGRVEHGFLSVVAYDDRLVVTALDLRGRRSDRFTLDG